MSGSDDWPVVDDRASAAGWDPFEFVPDRIDLVTASGLVELHNALNDRNTASLRGEEIEVAAHILWDLVDKGAIDLSVGRDRR